MSLNPSYRSAILDFQRMRRQAGLQEVFDHFRKHTHLLSYEDVRKQLRAVEKSGRNLQEIPIDAIQGSVGRYSDFTRDFLPSKNIDPQRWARVKAQFYSLEGIPPIEVYKIGEVYFVSDGNHRVSVAKEMGNSTIEAYVREVSTRVPLELDEGIDQLLIKAEYAEFLELTQFDRFFPDVSLTVTTPSRYKSIAQQIEAIHFSRELDCNKKVPYEEAVRYWYDNIYNPVINVIREQKILLDYPKRTETDLFLWIFKHQAWLTKSLGWEIPLDSAAKTLTKQPRSAFERVYNKSKTNIQKFFQPSKYDGGPPPGTWRHEKMASPEGRLFTNILVVIDDSEKGWATLSQAIEIAKQEGSQIYGLHTNSYQTLTKNTQQAIQAEFIQHCNAYNIRGQLAFEIGALDEIIKERVHWVDLVILSPDKITRDIRSLVQFCPVPLLLMKNHNNSIDSILLAYNGSPKSEEALFMAAYLTTFWEFQLSVITCVDKTNDLVNHETIFHAEKFLDHYGVDAQFHELTANPVDGINKISRDIGSNLIILGGYHTHTKTRLKNRVLDNILEFSQQAILICR